jgi:hypothetical protein
MSAPAEATTAGAPPPGTPGAGTTPAPGPAPAPVSTPAPGAATDSGGSPVTLEVSADRSSVTVGDPVTLTFRLRHAKDVSIVTFDADRALAALEVLDQKEGTPRVLDDGRVEEIHTVTVAAFETGAKELASVRVIYKDAAGREGSIAARRIPITVTSVLTEGQNEPADLKKPAEMPGSALWPWMLLAALLVAALVAFLWWRRRRRRPEGETALPAAPPRPAHEIAYAELQRLLSTNLLEKGAIKEFYIELAEIIRRYLGNRYGIDTFDRTSSEILESLRMVRAPVKAMAMVSEFLSACDLVKFAKYLPDRDETRRTVESAYRLVDETKAIDAPVAAVPAALAGGAAASGGAP